MHNSTIKFSQAKAIRSCFFLLILFAINGCANKQEPSFIGHWQLESIRYEDGTDRPLGGENSVIIDDKSVTESIQNLGKRRYPYAAQDKTLTLQSGGENITWEITELTAERMLVLTPLGHYHLQKQ